MVYVLIDKFDQSKVPILHIDTCPDCGRETILVDERCSLCWEKKFGMEVMNDRGNTQI